jgi:signal transduction histidine kinase
MNHKAGWMAVDERMLNAVERRVRSWRVPPIVGDILLTLLVLALSLGAVLAGPDRVTGALLAPSVALTLLQTLPLVARRRWPLAVLAVTATAVALALIVLPLNGGPGGLGLAVALYTVASRVERRVSLRLAVLIASVNALILLVSALLGRPNSWPTLFIATAFVFASWSLGDNIRTRRAYLAGLEERARRLEQEKEENIRRATQDERTRIARELHDVIAHHVSAIAVQAGAGAEIVERDPQRAREVLRFIQETSREALAEMRAMLNVLHSEEPGVDRAPQPTLAQIERLVNQSRAAGLSVTLQVEGAAQPLPEALDVSAYRIVQEALTNTLKHAGPAHAHVLVRYTPDALELEISDDGRGVTDALSGADAGRGLIGMRERVALFGGELETGPAPGHGFRVRACFPLRKAPT